MAKRIWTFELDRKTHTVTLDHGWFSGKREIVVDGKKLELPKSEAKQFFDRGSHHNFTIGKHTCTVLITTNGITVGYDLLIDGVSQKTGKKITKDLSSLKYYAFLFNKIDNRNYAMEMLKTSAYGNAGIVGFSALILSFLGRYTLWIDFVLISLIALWTVKKYSRIAALLLILYSGANLISTFSNTVTPNHTGGTNIYLAILAFGLAIRGFQAAHWLQKHKKELLTVKS